MDHYFRPKSVGKEEVLKYNGAVVLLEDGLARTYRGKNRLQAKLLASNFSSEPLQGELAWEVKAGERPLADRRVPAGRIPQGELAEVSQIDFELPDTASPRKLTITAELTAGGSRFANDWRSWLYPSLIRPAAATVPVFAEEAQLPSRGDWAPGRSPPRATSTAGRCTWSAGRATRACWTPCGEAPAWWLSTGSMCWRPAPSLSPRPGGAPAAVRRPTIPGRMSTIIRRRGPWRRRGGATKDGST